MWFSGIFVYLFFIVNIHKTLAQLSTRQQVTITENGYENLLLAIGEKVPYDEQLLPNIKAYFSQFSETLFKATDNRAYLRNLTILLPLSWKDATLSPPLDVQEAGKEQFQYANIIVDQANQQYGDVPYTSRPLPVCGQGGDFIHLTPNYLVNGLGDKYTRPGKALLHEWALLRWGVGREYPRPGTNDPTSYIGTNYFPPGCNLEGSQFECDPKNNSTMKPVICGAEMAGTRNTLNPDGTINEPGCVLDENGLTSEYCVFIPHQGKGQNRVDASIMYDPRYDAEDIFTFCDSDPNEKRTIHDNEAPTEHNKLCDERSVWEVLREHQDFANNANLPVIIPVDTTPSIKYVQRQPVRTVLVLDVSGSMRGELILRLKRDAITFLEFVPLEISYVGIVSFSTTASKSHPLKHIITEEDRQSLIDEINGLSTGGSTCIGCGLKTGVTVLEQPPFTSAAGGNLLLISDGEENERPYVNEVLPQLIIDEVIVDSILYSDAADPQLIDLAEQTGGNAYFDSGDESSTDMMQAFLDITAEKYTPADAGVPISLLNEAISIPSDAIHIQEITIDSDLGKNTEFSFTYPKGHYSSDVYVNLTAPSGVIFNSSDPSITSVDESNRIIRMSLPGVAETGRWSTEVSNKADSDMISAMLVLSSVVDSANDPILVQSFISDADVPVDPGNPPELKLVALVKKGNTPVLFVDAVATIADPGGTEINIALYDNGNGADFQANDGVFSAYFLRFTTTGKYTVKVRVSNDYGTAIIPGETVQSRHKRDILYADGTGSEPFNRQASGGFFSVSTSDPNDELPSMDELFNPGVVHLMSPSQNYNNREVVLEWYAVGAHLDSETATRYDIRVTNKSSHLRTETLFDAIDSNPGVDLLEGDPLSPKPPNQKERFVYSFAEDIGPTIMYFAMRVHNNHSRGDISNIVSAGFVPLPLDIVFASVTSSESTEGSSRGTAEMTTITGTSQAAIPEEKWRPSYLMLGSIIGVLLALILIGFIVMFVMMCRWKTTLKKNKYPHLESKQKVYAVPDEETGRSEENRNTYVTGTQQAQASNSPPTEHSDGQAMQPGQTQPHNSNPQQPPAPALPESNHSRDVRTGQNTADNMYDDVGQKNDRPMVSSSDRNVTQNRSSDKVTPLNHTKDQTEPNTNSPNGDSGNNGDSMYESLDLYRQRDEIYETALIDAGILAPEKPAATYVKTAQPLRESNKQPTSRDSRVQGDQMSRTVREEGATFTTYNETTEKQKRGQRGMGQNVHPLSPQTSNGHVNKAYEPSPIPSGREAPTDDMYYNTGDPKRKEMRPNPTHNAKYTQTGNYSRHMKEERYPAIPKKERHVTDESYHQEVPRPDDTNYEALEEHVPQHGRRTKADVYGSSAGAAYYQPPKPSHPHDLATTSKTTVILPPSEDYPSPDYDDTTAAGGTRDLTNSGASADANNQYYTYAHAPNLPNFSQQSTAYSQPEPEPAPPRELTLEERKQALLKKLIKQGTDAGHKPFTYLQG